MIDKTQDHKQESTHRWREMKIGALKLFALGTGLGLLGFVLKFPLMFLALGVVFGSMIAVLILLVLLFGLFKLWSGMFRGKPQQQHGAFALVFAGILAFAIYWGVPITGEKWAQKTPFSDRSTAAVDHQGNNLSLMNFNTSRSRYCHQLEDCYLPLIYGFADTVTITSNHHDKNEWESKTYKLSPFEKCKGAGENDKWQRGPRRLQNHGLFLQCLELLRTVKSNDLYEAIPDGLFVRNGRQDPSIRRPFTPKKSTSVVVATQVTGHEEKAELRRWERVYYPFTDKRFGKNFNRSEFVAGLYGHTIYPLEKHFDISLDEAIQRSLSAVNHEHFWATAALSYLMGVQKFNTKKGQSAQTTVSHKASLQYWQLMIKGCRKLRNWASCIDRYKKTARKLRIVAKPG